MAAEDREYQRTLEGKPRALKLQAPDLSHLRYPPEYYDLCMRVWRMRDKQGVPPQPHELEGYDLLWLKELMLWNEAAEVERDRHKRPAMME